MKTGDRNSIGRLPHARGAGGAWTRRAAGINLLLGAAGLLVSASPGHAQSAPGQAPPGFTINAIPAPPDPMAIPLYPGTAPGSEGAKQHEQWNAIMGERVVRNVVSPTLTAFLPDPAKATGAAVIVAPGGAYLMLSMDNEGWPVAKWLADRGIAAFVLKYRTDPTPADDAGFVKALGERFGAAGRAGQGKAPPISQPLSVADGQQALRLIRARAKQWGVDPARVGFLGFSAGAMTGLQVTLAAAPGATPDFVGSIYGPVTSVAVPSEAPPMFVALAADDGLFGNAGYGLVEAWQQAKRPIELHVYEKGGHGFGSNRKGTTSDHWFDEFYWWLEARGLLKPAAK